MWADCGKLVVCIGKEMVGGRSVRVRWDGWSWCSLMWQVDVGISGVEIWAGMRDCNGVVGPV